MPEHLVPARLFAPVIRSWIRSYPAERNLDALAERTGLPRHLLEKICSGVRVTLPFDVADLLLARMGRVDLWYSDLAEFYEPPSPEAVPARVPHPAPLSSALSPGVAARR